MLRNKTVANGASPGEAQNAAAKADELERRYGVTGGRNDDEVGPRVVVTVFQYQAMARGGVACQVRRLVPYRYRIDGDDLIRWTPADGESRHRIVRASMMGRKMVIRLAG